MKMCSPCLVSVIHLANYIVFCVFFGGEGMDVLCSLFQNNRKIFLSHEYGTPVVFFNTTASYVENCEEMSVIVMNI